MTTVGNAVKHVSSCFTPPAWPPPWLAMPAALADEALDVPAQTVLHLDDEALDSQPALANEALDVEAIDPPAPCPRCGSLELWQDLEGGWHCLHCEAAGHRRSQQLMQRATRLRQNQPGKTR